MTGSTDGPSSGARPWRGRSWRAALTVALAAAALALDPAGPAAAQEPRGLTFIGGLAYEPGGPGPAVLDELIAAGYVDQLPSSCVGPGCEPLDHPYYHDEGINVAAMVGMRYRFDAPLSLEVLVSNGQRGHAKGYDHEARDHLIVAYTALIAATTVGVHLGPLRLEAGPVFNSTSWTATHNSARSKRGRTGTVGGMAGASASVRLPDVMLSLKGGVRRFRPVDLRGAIQTPLEPSYHSFFVGLTAIPAGD